MSIQNDIQDRLERAPVVPLIGASDPAIAVQAALALQRGGLSVIEVVMRNPAAQRCMEVILEETTDLIVGAGTVLTVDQAKSVTASGSQFIVSPGLVDAVAEFALAEGIPIYPGTMTAGEVQRAYAMGLRAVKFFPASLAGGVPMLKAYGAVFGDMQFMPTGGVSAENLGDYLALPQVVACGGSWLTPKAATAAGDYAQIEALAREAVSIAQKSRK